jgi:hypothetical protein
VQQISTAKRKMTWQAVVLIEQKASQFRPASFVRLKTTPAINLDIEL